MFNQYGETRIRNGGNNCEFHINPGSINPTPGGPDLNDSYSPSPANSQQLVEQQSIDHLINHTGTFWNAAYAKHINVAVLNQLQPMIEQFKEQNKCDSPAFQNICNAINMLIKNPAIATLTPIQPTSIGQQNISLNMSTTDDLTQTNNKPTSTTSFAAPITALSASRKFAHTVGRTSSSASSKPSSTTLSTSTSSKTALTNIAVKFYNDV